MGERRGEVDGDSDRKPAKRPEPAPCEVMNTRRRRWQRGSCGDRSHRRSEARADRRRRVEPDPIAGSAAARRKRTAEPVPFADAAFPAIALQV
jgi:hypothetical protein